MLPAVFLQMLILRVTVDTIYTAGRAVIITSQVIKIISKAKLRDRIIATEHRDTEEMEETSHRLHLSFSVTLWLCGNISVLILIGLN
jgi:hypothetical protein